jgi:glycosyltransferase involved in cell wall biosynthesis
MARFVIDARYVRSRPSGIGSYVSALIERLPSLAPEEQFRLWTHPERSAPVIAPNLSARVVFAGADGARTLFAPALLDRLDPSDVIHFPYSLLGRGLPCASVVTVHDLMWLECPELVDARPFVRRMRQRFYRTGMRWALQNATRLLAVSNATADRIRAVAPSSASRIRVTRNAAGPQFRAAEDLEAALRRAHEIIGSSEPYYLVVGKNEPYKAHELAVRAFASVAPKNARLVLVQRESTGRGLSLLAEQLGVSQRVRWIPGISQPDLIVLLQAAQALLQPSLIEGFGIPVLEAMASGCPVIASATPSLVEVLGGAGLLAPVGNVAELAAAIERLQDGALRQELRGKGLERARAFSWDDTARATLEAYREARHEGPLGSLHA